MLESAILQVATRVNHGLCPSDVDWLQDGFLDVRLPHHLMYSYTQTGAHSLNRDFCFEKYI